MSEPVVQASAVEPHAAQLRSLARGGAAWLVGAVISAACNFLLVLVVARLLPKDDAGVFFAVTSLFMIAEGPLRLGADVGGVYFVSRWRVAGRANPFPTALRVGVPPVLVVTLLGAVVVEIIAPYLAHLLGGGDEATEMLRALAPVLPLASAYDVCLGATRGTGVVRPTVVAEQLVRPLVQLAFVSAVAASGRLALLGLAWGLPYVVSSLLLLAIIRRRHIGGVGASSFRARRARMIELRRQFFAFSLPRALTAAGQILLQRLDIVLVASLRGPADAAVYTAATRFLVLGQFVNAAINGPLQPRLSAAMAAHDLPAARTLYRVSTLWIVLLSWPLFCATMALAPIYLAIFGYHVAHGVVVVVVLAASMCIGTGVGVVDSVIAMAGHTSWNLGVTIASLAVNVSVDVALIPRLGIVGAAIGWAASILASNVVPLGLVWRTLHLHPVTRDLLLAASLCVACFLALPLVAEAVVGGRSLGAVVGVVIGAAAFVIAVARWRRRFALDVLRARSR